MTEKISRNHELMNKSKGHNSSKNYLIGTQIKLDLPAFMMNLFTILYTEFQIKMSMHDCDNERKP